jgi:hypothetical protein
MKIKQVNSKNESKSSTQREENDQKGKFYSWDSCCYMLEHPWLSKEEIKKHEDYVSLCYKIFSSVSESTDEITDKIVKLSYINKQQKMKIHRRGILSQTEFILCEKNVVEACLDAVYELNARLVIARNSCFESELFQKIQEFIMKRVRLNQGFYRYELLDHLDLTPEILDPILDQLDSLSKQRRSIHHSAEHERYINILAKADPMP